MSDPDRAEEGEPAPGEGAGDREYRRLEERLAESDKLWRALVASSPDIVLIVDTEGTIRFINRIGAPFVGHPVVGGKIWDFATEGAEARIRAVFRRLVETHEAVRYEAAGLPTVGKEKVWYEVCAIPLVIDGVVERILWSATDVSVRRNALETLSFQAELLSQVNQPVVATDGAGLISYWNDAAERLYGWTQAEVLGKESTDLLRARWIDPGGRDAVVAALTTIGGWQGEIAQTTKTGDEIVVEASIRLRRNGEGKTERVIAVIKDVTERKRLEDQLRQSQKLEAIGLLAGGVAHDFNNLLAIIMGFTEFSIGKLPPGHQVREQLDEVLGAARRGAELTRKLLAFSRKQIIQGRPVEVGAAVDDFARLLERVLGADIELSIERGAAALVVQADSVQLEQVLLNLCTNARQAMPAGGRLVLATRAAALDEAFVAKNPWSRAGGFAEIAVRDTGVGIDLSTRSRIFEPFFTTKREGTGLGLSTVYGIVQQHGGFVHVESAPGEGATFRVFLPLAGGLAGADAALSRPPQGTRGHELVLIAEDEPALRSLATTTLRDLGYRVIATSNGEEAVRAYGEHAADIALVVLDAVLPRLDACAVYERIRTIRRDVKVLFTTGYAPASTRLASVLEKVSIPVLEKPFMPSALAARVRSAIDG